MEVPDGYLYEYAVIRYVPRVDREEFVNIGLIMMCKRRKWLKGKVELNRERLEAFDPQIDFRILEDQTSMFMNLNVPFPEIPTEEKYRWMSAVKSAVLQVSPSHPGIIPECNGDGKEDAVLRLEREFCRLFKELVSC